MAFRVLNIDTTTIVNIAYNIMLGNIANVARPENSERYYYGCAPGRKKTVYRLPVHRKRLITKKNVLF